MDIDFVIAWVDGGDPAWRKEKAQYDTTMDITHDSSDERYRDWDILQYWFRAVENFAPWVHKIYFVTWGHLPKWLNTDNEKLVVVNHRDYIPAEFLPTFNANTIEVNFHRIPGLSEHFVYFNDDMFLARPVTPEDFFKDGKPCDTCVQDAVLFTPDSIGSLIANDLEIINKHFNKREQMKKLTLSQKLHPGYGLRNLYRTAVLSVWPWYTGFYCDHISSSFLKSTYETVWEKESKVLEETCRERIRSKRNVNQYLFKFWQFAEGNFTPRSASFGRAFHLGADVNQELLDALAHGTYGEVCVNDTPNVTDFQAQRDAVEQAFRKLLPNKSSFEK